MSPRSKQGCQCWWKNALVAASRAAIADDKVPWSNQAGLPLLVTRYPGRTKQFCHSRVCLQLLLAAELWQQLAGGSALRINVAKVQQRCSRHRNNAGQEVSVSGTLQQHHAHHTKDVTHAM
jgi:hypothetical protein